MKPTVAKKSQINLQQVYICHTPYDLYCLGDYRVEERPIPEVGEGDVLVKILAVGICAGDAKCFAGAPYFWGKQT